jgi:hypothetical protein
MTIPILTQERLKELLSYDPETGVFVRIKQTSSNAKIGDVAGNTNRNGYHYTQVDGTKFRTHRLIWLYMTGKFPPDSIDHIDRNPSNNRFANLRAVTKSENQHNQKMHCVNTSGFKGVNYYKNSKKWSAQITLNNVKKHLGTFFTPEEANVAYLAAQRIYHPTCPGL